MSKFKVGDKVRCINSAGVRKYVTEGRIYEVMSDSGEYIELRQADKGAPIRKPELLKKRFELVSEKSELEQLVETANAGIDAFNVIKNKYLEQVVEHFSDGDSCLVGNSESKNGYKLGYPVKYEIIPKPTFTPFKTKDEGYEVYLVGTSPDMPDNIKIGCAQFPLKELQAALRALVAVGAAEYYTKHPLDKMHRYQATRIGITHIKGKISWASAEQIYNAIKDLKQE